jgi:hypothetical protein
MSLQSNPWLTPALVTAVVGIIGVYIAIRGRSLKKAKLVFYSDSTNNWRDAALRSDEKVRIKVHFKNVGEESFKIYEILASYFNPGERKCPKPYRYGEEKEERPGGSSFIGYEVLLPANKDIEYVLALKIIYKSSEPLTKKVSKIFLFKCNPGNIYPHGTKSWEDDNPQLLEIRQRDEYEAIKIQLHKDFLYKSFFD